MGTLIVGMIVVLVIGLALRATIKNAKKGGCPGCSGSCSGCSSKTDTSSGHSLK